MPLSDLFGLLSKRQTSPEKYLATSVNVVGTGQHGALRQPFSNQRGISAFHSWVYAAATINANAVASMPIRLYAKSDESRERTRSLSTKRLKYLRGDMDRDVRPSLGVLRKAANYGDQMEEVVEHPILDLLATANPYLNGFDLTVLRILYGELTGNAYLHPIIDDASGNPSEIWPLAPQYVEVIPDEDDFISGYLYGIDAQHKQVFENDEVIHFRRPNPGNLYYGMGKVEAAYGVIQANQAVHDMDLATFANQARPDYAVVVKGNPTTDQLDRFQYQVQEKLRGTRKDGNFLTVTGDVQFTPLNFPPKDLAGREEIVEEIAAVFGVPVTMLKANDPNLASAQTGFAQWREGTVLPLVRMDEEELNQSLLPLFGLEETHCLAYDNPVPADKAFELQERQTAVAGGWRTPNEARVEEGKEPLPNEFADQLLVGGQPLGGALGGGGLLSQDEPVQEPIPDLESASAILEQVHGRRLSPYAATKLLQVSGFARSVAERMVKAQVDSRPVTKVQRMPGEPELDCIERGMEVLTAEGYERDQAYAIARSQCAQTKMVMRRPDDLYETQEEAEAVARAIGCEGFHTHEVNGETRYMPCAEMSDYTEITGEAHRDDDDLTLVSEKAIEDIDLSPTQEMQDLADRGLKLREEHGRGGTMVGVARARDIRNGENLSPETVGRMANFFSRHEVDLDAPAAKPGHPEYPSAGVIAWLLWGGDPSDPKGAGTAWASRKLDEIESAKEKAEGDRISQTPAEPDERIEGSDRNPAGSASDTRGGIEISETQETALKNKVKEHNEKHGDKKGKKVNLGMLKAVYRRGAGAFSGSHRPGMGRQQWAMARVNAFLYLVRNGRPEDSKYITDNDLLPKDHPKYSKKEKNACACGSDHNDTLILDSLGYDTNQWVQTKSAKPDPGVYEWPIETRNYRMKIEGLDDDFERKAVEDGGDADEDIRKDEQPTPAMMIRDAIADGLRQVEDRLQLAFDTGEVTPVAAKSSGKMTEAQQRVARSIINELKGLEKEVADRLQKQILAAMEGGGSAAIERLNLQLVEAGLPGVTRGKISAALSRLAASRGEMVARSVVTETIERFVSGAGQTFSLPGGDIASRSAMIARTESARAYHEGQVDAWEQSGTVKRKHFLIAPGACQYCKAVEKRYGEGKKSLPIGEPMVKAGETIRGTAGGVMKVGMSSQATVHPNCRCDFIAVLED